MSLATHLRTAALLARELSSRDIEITVTVDPNGFRVGGWSRDRSSGNTFRYATVVGWTQVREDQDVFTPKVREAANRLATDARIGRLAKGEAGDPEPDWWSKGYDAFHAGEAISCAPSEREASYSWRAGWIAAKGGIPRA